ncbi:magnesium-translocating P-type ATPase [Tengunoibacter tsumagoiensis]|uniref:Magnesium-transporting ATPase, P-type 1 n=1 Tax=Tengunoibacter tsumagoiensis TaxID=2014871 RepID=A0A401ZXM3_9CHLR|nr:magnesium-translocating P-type ATPase [Tengunoibacter tsumagoiensis]GCE11606.1 magnesium-translocating P-type ATPase [Tengunoibacter tsumagoiensis]
MQQSPSPQVTRTRPDEEKADISTVPLQKLFAQLESSEQGLTGIQASKHLKKYGLNDMSGLKHTAPLLHFLHLFLNPLIAILLIASIVSAILGDAVDAGIIIIIVLLSNVLNFIQTSRSQNAVEKLRADVAPTASVLRDGKWLELARREVVPGDIVRLTAGDMVPADARLIQATDLHVQQAALTGESFPVDKRAVDVSDTTENFANAPNCVFLGTSVVSGLGIALVTATGQQTAFGDIAVRLASHAPETEFERGIKSFGVLITQTVFFLVIFIVLVGIIGHHQPFETVLFAISLAVGLTPEFLPMITTVTLGQGALRMAKRKVIVKHLESIQNFGSIDTLCSDKTGTLTSGETRLEGFVDLLAKESKQVLLFGSLNSAYQMGMKSPLDEAILSHGPIDMNGYTKVGEIPFDFERRCLSVVVQSGDEYLIITKGAPESVLARCTAYEINGEQKLFADASDEQTAFVKMYCDLNSQGYRVLAVAYRVISRQEKYQKNDEQSLVLLGFLNFADPPKEDAARVLQTFKSDGVQVKILTGDNELVTRHVCNQVGIESTRIVLGSELDHMTDPALAQVVEEANVFARVSPSQKNRIILALKSRKHVVGYIGDGINDAPSLHAADVGISVSTGVDVAKDAADIILLEQSLQVLHDGILEGRKAFGNVVKYLLMGTSSNFGNMFSMAGAYVFLPFLPMLPSQILLNTFLYNISQVTIPSDNVDASYLRKPQQWNIGLIRNFMLFIGPVSSIFDFLTFFIMLRVFNAGETLFHTGWFVESLATQTLVLFVIRTAGNPLRSRPSLSLTMTTLFIVVLGFVLPYTPMAGPLGFMPLPPLYFLFLAAMIISYLLLVEVVKRRLMRRYA